MPRLILAFALCAFMSVSIADESVQEAKARLLEVIGNYTPGGPVTEELTAAISAAVEELERAAGTPNLIESPEMAAGHWRSLFSSQGIVGEIDVSFMTRALPGGGKKGGVAVSHEVLQELRPEEGFYRNMMVMTAGEDNVPLLHVATAKLGVAPDKPNDLTVQFRRIDFVPGRADVTLAQLRAALQLADDTPLTIELPLEQSRTSRSTVTYLDDNLRINRGKTYIAILQKVQ